MKKILLFENKKAKLLNILRLGVNPFKKFVSTGEIQETTGLVPSRSNLLNSILNLVETNENFILPVIGGVGTGKTHLFWSLKKKLHYHNTIYLSLENVYRKFYYNVYSEYVEDIGVDSLRNITSELCNMWGALDRKFGFFHVADIEKVRNYAFNALSGTGEYPNKIALTDIINVITAHQLDPYKKIEAERWLLGELMDIKELSRLNLLYDLKHKEYAKTMLKLIIQYSKLKTVLFIDDFDRIITLMKPSKDTEEIFDPSYLYGSETQTPESKKAEKTLDKIVKLSRIERLGIVMTLKSLDSLEKIKKLMKEKDPRVSEIFTDPLFLTNFEKNDIYDLYRQNFKQFLNSINYAKFLEEKDAEFFPLTKELLDLVYDQSQGNPREIIKSLIRIFHEIIYSKESIEDTLQDFESLF